jgi:hypothetical protein
LNGQSRESDFFDEAVQEGFIVNVADDQASLQRPIRELERWAREFRLWFKPQGLPAPLITIQSAGRRRALGWFARARWVRSQGDELHEINFAAEYLNRDVFDIAETLVHEFVHLLNFADGISDCTVNQYHNGRFRDRAESVGLICKQFDPYGWAKTSLSPELRERITALQPDETAFELFRRPEWSGNKQAKQKLRRWACSGRACASVLVASGQDLNACCLNCGTAYLPQ